MAIDLFRHNLEAYEASVRMLAETGKAAVIHPTGTGKSFIAFRLCQDHPEKTVCWLSPSVYIFKTQLENLRRTSGGYEPENIRFFTYARLMNLTAEEILTIRPDYIVLDEFHRCGAQMWGQGVQNLLKAFPEVPVLGLSATAIRYLDNQRNMADELFEGNVASEMTLGEAIVRGIVNPPKYILSVFKYQTELEQYEKRLNRVKSKAARDAGEQYLEALRRALEKAEGLEEIFAKHMVPGGKYIVFCANYEHLQEMTALAKQWFSGVDAAPHIYTAYSDDPETDKAFAAFREDNSGHLKLLYCIDMLNEGIHVADIDGVVLLRPTISPIIYKQQIGRALSADKEKEPVIFDIVMNIENLCSIGAIEEEVRTAVVYYRSLGRESEIVSEEFRVTEEVRDCMELFEKLNGSLTASWSLMYHYAREYARETGNLEIPKRYVTKEGYSLGAWLHTQRQVRGGKTPGNLTKVQIELLDAIGMRWENTRDRSWEKHYAAAKRYYEENGDLLVSISDRQIHGVTLGRWLAQLRFYRKSGVQSAYLTSERVAALDAIGMVWDVPDYLWEQNYHAALGFHRQHGHLEVPSDYVDENGIRLGAWLNSLRKGRTELTAEQRERLNDLGMNWTGRRNATWEDSYRAACEYYRVHGSLEVPSNYLTEDGLKLGRWINSQRENGALSEERKQKLNAIGMIWHREDPWDQKFRLVQKYYEDHGHVNMPTDYVVEGVWLRRWLSEQKARLNERPTGRSKKVKKLTEGQITQLESVGIRKSVG